MYYLQSVCYLSNLINIIFGTGIADALQEGIVVLVVAVLVLHFVLVGDDALFPMVKNVVAVRVPETEEVVVLIADTGAETASFKDGLGKDNLRIFDAVLLQRGIEVLYRQAL